MDFSFLAALSTATVWAIASIIILALWAFVVNERGGWSSLMTIILAFWIYGAWPPVRDVFSNPLNVVVIAVVYVLVGIVWARYKWGSLINRRVDFLKNHRDEFLNTRKIPNNYFTDPISVDATVAFREVMSQYLKDASRLYENEFGVSALRRFTLGDDSTVTDFYRLVVPQASNHKGSIIIWLAYWPIGIIWYLIADLMTDLFKGVYEMIGGYFQRVADNKFKNL